MADNEVEVLSEIQRILTQELDWRGAVEPSQHLQRDLQLDSLGLTVLAVGLEDRFRVRLAPEDAEAGTVGELVRAVVARAAGGGMP